MLSTFSFTHSIVPSDALIIQFKVEYISQEQGSCGTYANAFMRCLWIKNAISIFHHAHPPMVLIVHRGVDCLPVNFPVMM